MLPNFGNLAIVLAFGFTSVQILSFLLGNNKLNITFGLAATFAQFTFLMIAMIILIICFILNDFTVIYVRTHSHHLLPLIYKIGAAWGGHEGSLLLWCFILSLWTNVFALCSRKKLATVTFALTLLILGLLNFGFIAFLLLTSNPFEQDFLTTVMTGNDLTPLLQDPGLIFHPPMLYLGYVGFAIVFALAVAALLKGELDKNWVVTCRPWVILPWTYLGGGIILGSLWAYRELGWGGWWFWDPVENASLLPWLSATALLHSLIVTEKRQTFQGWTLLLAIITFSLSLLGTFLVRSGVLISVHTFANDPTRGMFLLIFLACVIIGSFLLYAINIHRFYHEPNFKINSRETLLLINSVVLLIAMATIILGTLYPIILESFHLSKISIGEPYFNTVFAPMMLGLLVLMGAAPHMNWGQQSIYILWKKTRISLLLSFTITFLILYFFDLKIYILTTIGLVTGIWIILSTLSYAFKFSITLKSLAMIMAHLGVAIMVLGVTINKSYSEERQVKMRAGETVTLSGYQFNFNKTEEHYEHNYYTLIATFIAKNKHGKRAILKPEQRIYLSHEQFFSKPGITYNPFRDLYLTLGALLPDGSWTVRIYYKPFVRWIWFGGFILLAGGLLSLFSYKQQRELL